MKLTSFRVRNYKLIRDFNDVPTGGITCLVGKNESGKTSLLKALYKLNPAVESHGFYDVANEYPKPDLENYQQAVSAGQGPATVTEATFQLDDTELAAIERIFGVGVLPERRFVLHKQYDNKRTFSLEVEESIAGKAILSAAGIEDELSGKWGTLGELLTLWSTWSRQKLSASHSLLLKLNKTTEPKAKKRAEAAWERSRETRASEQWRLFLAGVQQVGLKLHIWKHYLRPALPKFLYFDEYYLMEENVNIEQLIQRQSEPQALRDSDRPMLGLIELARLKLEDLVNAEKTEDLINKLEGASNRLTKKVLKYWSQSKHLKVQFDVLPAKPGDPEGFRTGQIFFLVSLTRFTKLPPRSGLGQKVFCGSFPLWLRLCGRKEPTNL